MKRRSPALMALFAAILFGASAPLSKLLLGEVSPVPLAALLYIGSGLGALVIRSVMRMNKGAAHEPPLRRRDLPWLAGAVIAGGIAAPIVLLLGLERTPAATASLLLNFEGAATAVIALVVFREAIGRRIGLAVGLITLASILLTWTSNGSFGVSLGALAVIGATVLWGFDNNFTRHISASDPLLIVLVKGLVAGGFNLVLSIGLGESFPGGIIILLALLLGSLSYGASIALFIFAMRDLGAARTSALFGTAPFAGTLLSVLLLNERPAGIFLPALILMVAGAWLLVTEDHGHRHAHTRLRHEHSHDHADGHHDHPHLDGAVVVKGLHTHVHDHEPCNHEHAHTPDLHHRHEHGE